MNAVAEGWLVSWTPEGEERVKHLGEPRHVGGGPSSALFPSMNCGVSVLWMPPGAPEFACRQSQFLGRDDRAHRGQEKIKSRLCSIGGFDPDEWDLPPKPKRMRWKTYNRAA